MLHSAPTDFQPWGISVCFSHPLINPLPNCSVRGNHIPHLRAAASLPGEVEGDLAPTFLCSWGVFNLKAGFACPFPEVSLTMRERRECYFLYTFSLFSLLYFPLYFNWSQKLRSKYRLYQQTNLVLFLTSFAISLLSWHWKGVDASRQGAALTIYLNWGVFFREQMANLFQHFR